MPDPLKHSRRALPGHESEEGGRVVAQIVISVHASGALAVSGSIGDRAWALAVLENAKDAINGHHNRQLAAAIVPAKDVDLG